MEPYFVEWRKSCSSQLFWRSLQWKSRGEFALYEAGAKLSPWSLVRSYCTGDIPEKEEVEKLIAAAWQDSIQSDVDALVQMLWEHNPIAAIDFAKESGQDLPFVQMLEEDFGVGSSGNEVDTKNVFLRSGSGSRLQSPRLSK